MITQSSALLNTRDSGSAETQGSGARAILWAIWFLLLAAGTAGLWERFSYGHNAAGYGSYVPWGLWIALYFMGVAIGGGAFVFGAVGYILGWEGLDTKGDLRTAIILSVAAILPAFMVIWLDLGRMDRLLMVFTSATFTSMIAFNAWMYNSFLVVALICWFLSFKGTSLWLRPFLCLGALLSILFPSQSGVFFEAVGTKQYWNSPLLSMMFLSSALAAGAGSLLLVRALQESSYRNSQIQPTSGDKAIHTLRFITVAALMVYLAFEFAELSIAVWRPSAESRSVDYLIRGDYWWVFWILQLLVGALLPLGLYLLSTSRAAWGMASVLLIMGFVAARMGILIPGQVVGQIPGLQDAFQDSRLIYAYHPTQMEYLIAALMIAAGMAVFYVGGRLSSALASNSEQKA